MAERRMFAKTIVLSDEFLDMPMSSRCLYSTLGMFADDDGFVNNPKSILRQCGASQDDMRILVQKRFILLFESGVIVIKHWRINNYLRSDRYSETKYTEEKAQLTVKENGAYSKPEDDGIPMVYQVVYPDKDSIGKVSIDNITDSKESVCRTQSDKSKVKSQDIQQVVDTWNALSVDVGLQTILRMSASSQRCKMTAKRIAEYGTANVVSTIQSIRHSRFLQGDNNRNWIITYDWFIKPNNYPKVADGNYLDREYRNKASKSETMEEAIDMWGDDS